MHRLFNIAIGASVIALGLIFIGPSLDSYDASKEKSSREFRRDMQAAQYCRELHGESGFEWTENGELVCIPRRGKKFVAPNQ